MMHPQLPCADGDRCPLLRTARPTRSDAALDFAILAVCIAAIVGIWLTTVQRSTLEREQAVTAALKSNANLAIAFEQQVSRTLKAAEQVAAFVRDQYLQHGAAIDLLQLVEQKVIREQLFNIVSVVDETGGIVASSTSIPPGQVNYADRQFFTTQRDSVEDVVFVSTPVLGRVSGRWQIPMSLRITRSDGRFGGVVVLSVEPAMFTGFDQQADIGPQSLLELTGLDGIVRGRKIGSENSFGLDAAALPWFKHLGVMAEGGFVDDGASIDKIPRVISYRKMADYPMMVTVGTAYDSELAAVEQRRSIYLLMASAATFALLVFAASLILVLTRQRAAARALHASEALFRATFHQAAMGIAHIQPDGRILGANDKFCTMLGYSLTELQERSVLALSPPTHRDEAAHFLSQQLSVTAQSHSPEIEKPYRRKDGSTLWVCEALSVVGDDRSRPDFLVAVTQDITARKDLEARLQHAALHDPLTGLPNRIMFMDRLSRVLETARRHNGFAAVLYIDLDGFKAVNDEHGHAAGDRLLIQVAQRLTACIRAEDTVSRFGGDEFGVVLASLTQASDCEAVALKIIDLLSKPVDLKGLHVQISASIGASAFPADGEEPATLLARADAAMYVAKGTGKNRFSWGHPGI